MPNPAARTRKSQVVVEKLLDRIRTGQYSEGDRLPSERDLAVEFEVSRNAIREALQVLQLSGHVETRLGDGSFVANGRLVGGADDDASLLAGISISESLDMREAIELASALTAVRRATRSDLMKLQAIVVELEELLEQGDYKAYLLATLDLHLQIAAASHSPYLIRVATELTERHRDDQWLLHDQYTPEVAAFSLEVHRDLANGIVDKDPLAVIAANTRHYEDYPVLHRQ